MKRRDFIKLFGALPASIFAGKVLSAVPSSMLEAKEVSIATNTMLEEGIWENILSTSHFLQDIPKLGVEGDALVYNRAFVGGLFEQHTANLVPIIGECVEEQGGPMIAGMTYQLSAKAKSIGRATLDIITNGDAYDKPTEFDGLFKLAGKGLSGKNHLLYADYDWVMLNIREYREIKRNKRLIKHLQFKKIYLNYWINRRSVIIGKFDDGTRTKGVSLIHAKTQTDRIGRSLYNGVCVDDVTEDIKRIKFYPSLAVWDNRDISVINI